MLTSLRGNRVGHYRYARGLPDCLLSHLPDGIFSNNNRLLKGIL